MKTGQRGGGGEWETSQLLNGSSLPQVLLLHGDRDAVFPLEMVERTKESLKTAGIPTELRVLFGQSHAFGMDRHVVIRAVGEYIKAFLTPGDPLPELPVTKDYWYVLCIAPAFLWGGFWLWWRFGRSGSNTITGKADNVLDELPEDETGPNAQVFLWK